MPVNLLHVSSHSCAVGPFLPTDSNPGLCKPRDSDPGTDGHILLQGRQDLGHRSGHPRSCEMMVFEMSYSGMVSDRDEDYFPIACQREIRKEKFVAPNNSGRGSVFASGVLVCVLTTGLGGNSTDFSRLPISMV